MEATRALRRPAAVAAVVALALAAGLSQQPGSSAASGLRYCSPVVTNTGPGYSKASVYILTGRTDCEKARPVIWQALSPSSYKKRQIAGWSCASTSRAGKADLYGARCERNGPEEYEAIKSTVPHRCGDCDGIRK
jgi:hypothetical protein